ncbi:hypothetical protein [Clostridium haemolyticum]|uniref:hypothetical protein n=1 Tax=Clostridium haemolyticum TaxID=84025 RepID=UPI0006527450|nr:hypothetical protein [Clostridium haemolyticum]
MIFLGNLNKITDEKYSIGFIHYIPFDKENGLNKSKEQLEQEGVLIESIPKSKQIECKQPIMYWNPIKKEIFYEYKYIPKTKEELQEIELENLKKNNEVLTETIAKLTIDSKKKDMLATQLASTVATMNIEINKIKEGVK